MLQISESKFTLKSMCDLCHDVGENKSTTCIQVQWAQRVKDNPIVEKQ